MDDYRGTVYKVGPDGRYSGEIIPMWDSESKQCAVLEMAKQYGIDLSESYAYGDTNGDFAMMKLVGHPVAVNPTQELLTHIQKDDALRKKIVVIVERKDVIYRLNMETLNLAD
jgi:phosphoserine phosphatase